MRTTTFFCLLSLALFGLHCESDSDEPAKQDFSCIRIYDDNGFGLGLYGCTSNDDWSDIPLDATESAFLDFSDTVGVTGTVAAAVEFMAAYPNPVVTGNALNFSVRSNVSGQEVKIKMAIVDESLQPVAEYALRTTTNGNIALQIDAPPFQTGQYYRLYYRVSSESDASLFEGYGNILVCKTNISGGNTIEADCM